MPYRRKDAQLVEVEIDPRRAAWLYRAQNFIWLTLGVAASLAAIQFWVDDNFVSQTAIGRNLSSNIDDLWNIMWLIGGVLMFYGVWTLRWKAEIIGHVFLASALITNAVAVSVIVPGGASLAGLISLALGSVGRASYIYFTRTH